MLANRFLVVLLLLSPVAMAREAPLADLKSLLWKHRITVIFTAQPEHPENTLIQAKTQVDDRDIVWFIVSDDALRTNYSGAIGAGFSAYLRNAFGHHTNRTILIGKDGGVKQQSSKLKLEDLFGRIDTMPMRIREMQDR